MLYEVGSSLVDLEWYNEAILHCEHTRSVVNAGVWGLRSIILDVTNSNLILNYADWKNGAGEVEPFFKIRHCIRKRRLMGEHRISVRYAAGTTEYMYDTFSPASYSRYLTEGGKKHD